MFSVLAFLVAIVLANLTVAWFGPWIMIVNAFVLIGLDLSLRDKLHEAWHGKRLVLKMFGLIVTGGIITYLLNRGAGRIALASVSAFALASIVDAVLYEVLFKRKRIVKMNGSNIGGALVDSIAFPTIAFGSFMPLIILGQFGAKVAGGFLWSLVLTRRKK